MEEASISVTCETADPYFQKQQKAPRFGREVPHNTNVFPTKKPNKRYDSESSSRILEDAFKTNSYPTSKERLIIAKKCGLSPTQVGAWVCIEDNSNMLDTNIFSSQIEEIFQDNVRE